MYSLSQVSLTYRRWPFQWVPRRCSFRPSCPSCSDSSGPSRSACRRPFHHRAPDQALPLRIDPQSPNRGQMQPITKTFYPLSSEIDKKTIGSKQVIQFHCFCFEKWTKYSNILRSCFKSTNQETKYLYLWFETVNRETKFLILLFETVNQETGFWNQWFVSKNQETTFFPLIRTSESRNAFSSVVSNHESRTSWFFVSLLISVWVCYQPGGKLARRAFGYQSLCTLYLGVLLECQSAIEWQKGWSIGQGSRLKWQWFRPVARRIGSKACIGNHRPRNLVPQKPFLSRKTVDR